MSENRKIHIVIAGPALNVKGGMSSFVRYYFSSNLCLDFKIIYHSTTIDCNKILQIFYFIKSFVFFIIRLTINRRIKIIHICSVAKGSFYRKAIILLMSKLFAKKTIFHIHGAGFDLFYNSAHTVRRFFIRIILDISDSIVVLSHSWFLSIKKMTRNRNIKIIPNAIDVSDFKWISQYRHHVQLNVLTLGHLCQSKGTYDIIDIIPIVLREIPEAKFYFAGKGDFKKVRRLCQERGIENNVIIQRWLDKDRLIESLKNAAIFLLPSYQEGFPISILEAMASGLPVISTKVGGIPEIVEDGINGFLVNPGQKQELAVKIIGLLRDRNLREEIGKNNVAKTTARFNLSCLSENFSMEYKRLLLKRRNLSVRTKMKGYASKRILILVENLPVPFNKRVWLEGKALKESGHSITFICPKFKEKKSFEIVEGMRIYRYCSPPEAKGIFCYVFEFIYCFIITFVISMWIFFKYNFDVIHAGNPPDTFFIIGIFYKLLGKKFYFDQHDLSPELYLSKFGEQRKDFFYRMLLLLEYLSYKAADKVIVTNNSYREIAISRGQSKPDKVSVIRTSIDLKEIRPIASNPRLRQGKRYIVSYLGMISRQDGADLFLRIIDIIVNRYKHKDILFSIIGDGDSVAYLKKLKEAIGLDGSLVFIGRLQKDALFEYLSTSDVCVAPESKSPLNDKSTMHKLLDYMAMARPIVCFDLKESRYLAGQSALYVDPDNIQGFADKILELLEDDVIRNKMGMAGHERLRQGELSWDYNKKKLTDIYCT